MAVEILGFLGGEKFLPSGFPIPVEALICTTATLQYTCRPAGAFVCSSSVFYTPVAPLGLLMYGELTFSIHLRISIALANHALDRHGRFQRLVGVRGEIDNLMILEKFLSCFLFSRSLGLWCVEFWRFCKPQRGDRYIEMRRHHTLKPQRGDRFIAVFVGWV